MIDRVQEQLLGYLLGALAEPEQKQIARRLAGDPALRRELARMRRTLGVLGKGRCRFEPPAGLAARTCQFVAQVADRQPRCHRAARAGEVRAMSPVPAPPTASSRWSWADLAVAVGILATATLLLFPAIERSRFHSQLVACQDNLRQIGVALAQYGRLHGDRFPLPQAAPHGRLATAGIYAPTLTQNGLLPDARHVFCPGFLPTPDAELGPPAVGDLLVVDSPGQLNRVLAVMGGSYGYPLEWVDGSQDQTAKNLRRPLVALVADVAGDGDERPVLYHGRGQNVLFEDGRVVFFLSSRPSEGLAGFFVDEAGRTAAAVAGSEARVGPRRAVRVLQVDSTEP